MLGKMKHASCSSSTYEKGSLEALKNIGEGAYLEDRESLGELFFPEEFHS